MLLQMSMIGLFAHVQHNRLPVYSSTMGRQSNKRLSTDGYHRLLAVWSRRPTTDNMLGHRLDHPFRQRLIVAKNLFIIVDQSPSTGVGSKTCTSRPQIIWLDIKYGYVPSTCFSTSMSDSTKPPTSTLGHRLDWSCSPLRRPPFRRPCPDFGSKILMHHVWTNVWLDER